MPSQPLQPDGMSQPIVRSALARDSALRKFLGWAILPVADVKLSRCNAQVTIGDARYVQAGSRRSRLAHETIVPLAGAGC